MKNRHSEPVHLVIVAQFGPPALAAIRSWGRRGAAVGLIQIASKNDPIPWSKYLSDHIAMTSEQFQTPSGLEKTVRFLYQFSADALLIINEKIFRFDGTILAQPFKNLPNLVIHGVRGPDGVHHGLTGFIVKRKFEGVTLNIQYFKVAPELCLKCIAFVDEFKVLGPYLFEFLYDLETGILWFLELNTRLGGTTAKVMALGYDEPAWTLKAFGYDIEPGPVRRGVIASSKKALMRFLSNAIRGKLTPLDYPNESRLRRIAAAVSGFFIWRDDIFDWRDFKGMLALYGIGKPSGVLLISQPYGRN